MKSLIVVVLTLTFYNFQAVLAQNEESKIDNWFNMKLNSDVNVQCESKTNNAINSKTYTEYLSHLEQYAEPLFYEALNKYDYVFKYIYNPVMIEKLKELIQFIQDCLDDEKRLDAHELVTVMDRILTIHAKRVLQLDSNIVRDMGACRFIVDNKMMKYCTKTYQNLLINPSTNEITIFQLLTGSPVTKSSCKEILPLEQCFMKAFVPCSSNTRKYVKLFLSPPDNEMVICEDFLQETDVNDKDINDVLSQGTGFFKKMPPLFRVQ